MAAGLHGSCHQEEMIRLLLNHGADPSIRNLENDQPVHLLQSGEKGEQVSHPTHFSAKIAIFAIFVICKKGNLSFRRYGLWLIGLSSHFAGYDWSSEFFLVFWLAEVPPQKAKCCLSTAYYILTGPRVTWTAFQSHCFSLFNTKEGESNRIFLWGPFSHIAPLIYSRVYFHSVWSDSYILFSFLKKSYLKFSVWNIVHLVKFQTDLSVIWLHFVFF